MRTLLRSVAAMALLSMLPSAQLASAQSRQSVASPAPSNFPAEYPNDGASVLVENSRWVDLSAEFPSRIRPKRGLVGALTYGAISASVIVEYQGQHAQLRIETRRPVFCICNVPSFAGGPALVRLHPKNDLRELDGGRLPVLGVKIAEAKQSDQVPNEAVQPEKACWLMRPREDLPVGEYALLLGTQNMVIFPFTTSKPAGREPQRQGNGNSH